MRRSSTSSWKFSKSYKSTLWWVKHWNECPLMRSSWRTLSLKREPYKKETNVLSEKCNAILQRNMEIKNKDLWSDIIPCTIGDKKFKKVLMDLDSSVCLTPLSIYKTMDIWIISQKIMTLQFSNNFVNHPYGIVEYVLVKIYKSVFLVDSYIL